MEKIKIQFKQSGIRITRICGMVFIALGAIFGVGLLIAAFSNPNEPFLAYAIISAVTGIGSGAFFVALSAITKNLYIANIQRDRLLKSKGIELSFYEPADSAQKTLEWLKNN